MKPHRVLKLRPCKCGSTDIAINFYFRAKMEGDPSFLFEQQGFVSKLECCDCGRSGMRYHQTTEDSIRSWNTYSK